MSTITAIPDSTRAQVRLDVDFSDVNASYVTITRANLVTGVVTPLRYTGSAVNGSSTTLGGRLVVYDTEVPLDTAVSYTAAYPTSASVATVLNTNPYFENGRLTPWTAANNATLAVVTSQFHQGSSSLQVTPNGVTAAPQAVSDEVVAVAGATYTLEGWLRSTLSTARVIRINWYDGTHTLLSSSSITLTPGATTWTHYGPTTFTAPASTAFARACTVDTGTPAGTNLWWVDQVTITAQVSASATSSAVTVAGNGRGWLKDPVRPGNNVWLDMNRPAVATRTTRTPGVAYLGLGDQVGASNMTIFNVNNSAYPVVVTRVREAITTTAKLFARTPGDVTNLDTLFSAGSVLLLQLPAAYSEPDRYVVPGATTKSPVFTDQRRPGRLYSVPLTSVQSPKGPAQGASGIRFTDLCNHAPTWGFLYAQGGGTFDSFTRTTAAGSWSSPEVAPVGGSVWSLAGTVNDFSVNGTAGQVAVSAVNVHDDASVSGSSLSNVEAYLTCVAPVVALTSPYRATVIVRRADGNNYYALGIEFQTSGVIKYLIMKRAGGVDTVLVSPTGPTYTAGSTWKIHALANGTSLSVSAWKDGTAEPVEYSATTTDATISAANPYGVMVMLNTGNTNTLPVTVSVDNFQVKGNVTWQGVLDGVLG